MPRMPRIDAPGMIHHIFARGIERREIFFDDKDRNFFLERLGNLVLETENPLYTFALLPNHFHLLIRRGKTPVSTLMQRMLTTYAIYFNRRHDRSGHLFQNRYKSCVCDNEAYFFELLRYINLNPVRAGICSHDELDVFRFAGHSYFMGKSSADWLDSGAALLAFGDTFQDARDAYAHYLAAGMDRHADAVAGPRGKEPIAATARPNRDSNNCPLELAEVLDATKLTRVRDFLFEGRNKVRGETDLVTLYEKIGKLCGVTQRELVSKSKTRRISLARTQLANEMSKQLGLTRSDIARELAVNPSAVSKMLSRARSTAEKQDR